jgi:hypothetical protein
VPHLTFAEQVQSHLNFLNQCGLNPKTLQIDLGIVRCLAIGEEQGRGSCAYQTIKNIMKKPGMVGLVTWCRGPNGVETNHKTYGLDGIVNPDNEKTFPVRLSSTDFKTNETIPNKAQYLWDQSKMSGFSDYLERKGVGSYRIRFMENEYGRVAVIPAINKDGTIQTLQFLNPDGNKRFLKGSKCDGLFHLLTQPDNGNLIGVAESYVTAATCYELTGIDMVCAFHSGNLLPALKSLVEIYPESRFIIFADNDRHLEARGLPNQGTLKALQARKSLNSLICCIEPEFVDCSASKEASDWNDLVRIKGCDFAKEQIFKKLNSNK